MKASDTSTGAAILATPATSVDTPGNVGEWA